MPADDEEALDDKESLREELTVSQRRTWWLGKAYKYFSCRYFSLMERMTCHFRIVKSGRPFVSIPKGAFVSNREN